MIIIRYKKNSAVDLKGTAEIFINDLLIYWNRKKGKV